MPSIVVTGGAGFIGVNFVRRALTESSVRVVVADALTYAGHRQSLAEFENHDRFAFEALDIRDRRAVEKLFGTYQPTWVIHLAAETHVDRSIDDPRLFVSTNVDGTLELLEAARGYWGRQNPAARQEFRFVQVSTDEVYGTLGASGRFHENSPYAPRSPYSASKAAADHLVAAYHHTYGLPVLTTHCSNNYGPYQFPEKLIPLSILNALEGKPLPIYGDGLHVRDWIYVGDHCDGIWEVARAGLVGDRYHIGGDSERTNIEVVDAVCAVLDELAPPHENPVLAGRGLVSYAELKSFVADRPGHDRRYGLDAARCRDSLGWRPRHDFGTGIRSTVAWYLSHRLWCQAVEGQGARRRLGL